MLRRGCIGAVLGLVAARSLVCGANACVISTRVGMPQLKLFFLLLRGAVFLIGDRRSAYTNRNVETVRLQHACTCIWARGIEFGSIDWVWRPIQTPISVYFDL